VLFENKILNETTNHNPPPFKLNGRSLSSVEQLQTLPKTQSEIDISPFLKTPKSSILYSIILYYIIVLTNIIHLDRRPPKFLGPRLQPIEPIGKSGTSYMLSEKAFN
jgi:hypothetical protein